jgi:hypothetical protein
MPITMLTGIIISSTIPMPFSNRSHTGGSGYRPASASITPVLGISAAVTQTSSRIRARCSGPASAKRTNSSSTTNAPR